MTAAAARVREEAMIQRILDAWTSQIDGNIVQEDAGPVHVHHPRGYEGRRGKAGIWADPEFATPRLEPIDDAGPLYEILGLHPTSFIWKPLEVSLIALLQDLGVRHWDSRLSWRWQCLTSRTPSGCLSVSSVCVICFFLCGSRFHSLRFGVLFKFKFKLWRAVRWCIRNFYSFFSCLRCNILLGLNT